MLNALYSEDCIHLSKFKVVYLTDNHSGCLYVSIEAWVRGVESQGGGGR